MRSFALVLFSLQAFGQAAPEPTSAEEWFNRGVQLFKSAAYEEAVSAFQKVISLKPAFLNARLHLGNAYLAQFVPGNETPGNVDKAHQAEAAFNAALQMEPQNRTALAALASVNFQLSNGFRADATKQRYLEQSEHFYRRILDGNPADKEALYSLGVIAWSKVYPENQRARKSINMRPEDPGPIRDNNLRLEFKNRHGQTVEEGMANLRKAIESDPQYDDAMAYLNLLYRQAADMNDTEDEYKTNIAAADTWVRRALEVKKAKASAGAGRSGLTTAPPPPPSPGVAGAQAPTRIRVGGNIQAKKVIYKPTPLYPPQAKEARIQGTVRFEALIGRDGAIANLTLISGHPLFVPASSESVRQWRYEPTLLNGQPVEVITQIDVNFTLSE
jgi:tetratricopeptide (TPR) repeat protein